MLSCGEAEKLFSKELTVNIKDGTVDRKVRLHITLDSLDATARLIQKGLILCIRDEADPFFLLMLKLNHDDFQRLKSQQGLLVDVPAFPQYVIDLLKQCLKEELKDNPRFLLRLSLPSRSGLDTLPAIFEIVETNPFKCLIHLSLKIFPPSDANMKKFLGISLRALKEEKERLERRLHATENDFQLIRSQDQENYARLSEEFVKMETKYKTELATKENKFRDERERLQKMHFDEELRWVKEKREQEKSYQVKICLLEDCITHLETSSGGLKHKLYKSDSEITTLQEEVQQLCQKLQIANKEQAELEAKCQDQLTQISHLKDKLLFSEELTRENEQQLKALVKERNNLQKDKKALEDWKMKALEINNERESHQSVQNLAEENNLTKTSEVMRENYRRWVEIEEKDLISNLEPFECPVCFLDVPANEGIMLKDCLHLFCKKCLSNAVYYAEEAVIKCPFRNDEYACDSHLQEREIKALVSPEVYERHLQQSIAAAESQAKNSFHCKSPDCPGWCLYEDKVNLFLCPVCDRLNCLTCQAIHEGRNCQQYQDELEFNSTTSDEAKKTKDYLDNMLKEGEAMRCPQCHIVLMKKWGCDWLKCSVCLTEVCWVTKGRRWGPAGQGDTSGGCRCGVNGVRCHPKCNYCH